MKVKISNRICFISIDREEYLNAINLKVLSDLKDVFLEHQRSKEIRSLILTGEGKKAFIAGADIKAMSSMSPNEAYKFSKLGNDLTLLMDNYPKPIIAAINGYALGGGCEIAMACHIRYASENAKFGQPEVKLGLIPGWGGTQRLPRIVGKGNATELIIGGHMIDAKQALRIGLVNKIFPLENLLEETINFAKEILKNGPDCIAESLRCINNSAGHSLMEGLDIEVEAFSELFGTDETTEGLNAFVDKRKPKFRG